MRDRKIFGELVPYGQVWRTGANAATSLKTDVDLTIGGASVPAGSYTLYSIPEEKKWKLIINKETGQWGTKYDEKQDLARVDMKVSKNCLADRAIHHFLRPDQRKCRSPEARLGRHNCQSRRRR